jgi:membrane fusion protein (multidrug efflux system)
MRRPRGRSPRPRPIRPALALCLAAALLAPGAAPAPARAQSPPGVLVYDVERVAFPLTVEALGTAIANESVEIRPRVSKAIATIRFTEGQSVERGAILVTLDDAEAAAAVAASKANLVESEGQYRRGEELRQSGLVSDSELDRLRARRDADRAAVDAAESRLADTVVRAPFAGRVGLRRVSVGSLVGPSTVITTLDAMNPMKLDFDVPETALAHLRAGLPIVARSAAWPDSSFRGRVDAVDTRVDPISRTVIVRAVLPNPRGLLKPGMFLTVTLLRRDVTAIVVPEQAIVPLQSNQYLLVVGKDGTVERRAVRTGRRRPGQIEILSGVAAGETVVAEGTQKARAGEKVRIVGRIGLKP